MLDDPTTPHLLASRGIDLGGASIRQHAARGVLLNSGFSIVVATIALVRGLVVARFLTRADYGIWGILMVSLGTLWLLKQVGVADKYVQHDAEDEELAFQKAFTIECIFNGALMVLLLIAVPVVALIYRRSELILPGLAMALLLPAQVLSTPVWIFSRRLRFGRQRLLAAIDVVVGTATALALAVAGAGYWSLMAGVLAGAWSSGLASVIASPYRLRIRPDRALLRAYAGFSWPLLVASGSIVVIGQTALFFGTEVFGLAGAGAITLAANISVFARSVDAVVSGTMYPVVCALARRVDLLRESFSKSNRVALLWAVPFGFGLALFAGDLVHYGIGDRWRPAIPLLVVFGLTEAIGHVGFNWDDYFRARGETRPMARASLLTMASFILTAIPLLYIWGLAGFAAGVMIQTLVNVGCRMFYLRRLFEGLDMLRHAIRAYVPALLGTAAVLLVRAGAPRGRSLGEVALELCLYLGIALVLSWTIERRLLGEMVGYLGSPPRPEATARPDVPDVVR